MLIMFKVKNYMSFKDETILDLRATSYKQHPSHVLHISDDIKLLKTTAIYGANASGKSNLVAAIAGFRDYVLKQFIRNDKEMTDYIERNPEIFEPFILSENLDDTFEFDIIFINNNKQIQYGFESKSDEVIKEWYYINGRQVFDRTGSKIQHGRDYIKILKDYEKVPNERLYISIIDFLLTNEDKSIILDDFNDFMFKKLNVYSELLLDFSVKKFASPVRLHKRLIEDHSFLKLVESYIRKIDVGIQGLEIQTKTILDEKTNKERKIKIIKTVHDIYDTEGNMIRQIFFDLSQESTGTLRFLSYIQNIIILIEQGGVFIVDELSARLHPLLTKLIIDIFQSSENEKAQLVFTTHDISQLNKDQFRRDEVVFVDKNQSGVSKLYALSDLQVREDATFNKDYLQGKYGAIPIFNYDELLRGGRDGKD